MAERNKFNHLPNIYVESKPTMYSGDDSICDYCMVNG